MDGGRNCPILRLSKSPLNALIMSLSKSINHKISILKLIVKAVIINDK